jgi:hypothetical protein
VLFIYELRKELKNVLNFRFCEMVVVYSSGVGLENTYQFPHAFQNNFLLQVYSYDLDYMHTLVNKQQYKNNYIMHNSA